MHDSQQLQQVEPEALTEHSVRRVLILDDDPTMLRLLTDYLRAPHLHLVTCTEIEAAECLLEHHRYDVLISDLEVSNLGGLEGMRLIRHAAFHFPDIRVIVFSGRLDDGVRRLARALGAAEVLAKPADLPRIRELVGWGPADGPRAPRLAGGQTSSVQALDELLEERAISAVLQPIVSLDEASPQPRLFGAEGLARGPADSLLHNPEVLLGYASRKAKLFETELQCIEAVLGEASELPEDSKLFVNVRPRSLSAPDAATRLIDTVRAAGRRVSQIVLELTEQQTILNPRAFHETLRTLCECGFGIALDDYGQGFANLHLVQELRPDYLKIDGFFCTDIHLDPRKQAMVRSTVAMAKELDISIIMEHVESEGELEAVRELGVGYAQGYWFSKPIPGRDLASWVRSARPVAKTTSFPTTVGREQQAPAPLAPVSERHGAERHSAVHQLNNVLTAITLCATHASDRLPPGDPNRLDFEQISKAAELAVAEIRKLEAETADEQPVLLAGVA